MNLKVSRANTDYDLGTWNLTASPANNDIFSVTNAPNLNILNTFNILKATGISSGAIFNEIDFHGILTAAQGMSAANKANVYNGVANIFAQAQGNASLTAFYDALNLPSVYAAAGTNDATRTAITNILAAALAAVPGGAGVTAAQLVGSGTSQAAVTTLTTNGKIEAFFGGIDFITLFNALSNAVNKDAIYAAIDFTALFNAVDSLPSANKTNVYLYCAIIYQAATTVDTSNAIDYAGLLTLAMTNENAVTLSLSSGGITTTYTVSQ
jgi:hypothetical protein